MSAAALLYALMHCDTPRYTMVCCYTKVIAIAVFVASPVIDVDALPPSHTHTSALVAVMPHAALSQQPGGWH